MICWRSLATLWTGWANRATSRQAQPWTRPAPTRPTAIIMPSSIHGPEAAIRRQGPTEFITANGRRSSRLNNGAIRETAKSITAVRDPSLDHIIRPSNPSFWLLFVYTSSPKQKSPSLTIPAMIIIYNSFFVSFFLSLSPSLFFSKAGLECIDDDDDGGRQRAAGEEKQLYIFFPPLLRDLCNLRDSRVKGRLLWERRNSRHGEEEGGDGKVKRAEWVRDGRTQKKNFFFLFWMKKKKEKKGHSRTSTGDEKGVDLILMAVVAATLSVRSIRLS